MMEINIKPGSLKGKVEIPPSKSLAHRYIIGASLGEEEVIVSNLQKSKDIEATIEVMSNLGVEFKVLKDNEGAMTLKIKGQGTSFKVRGKEFNCNESGSTLRFLIPLLLLIDDEVLVIGKGKLKERPLDVYYDILKDQGIEYSNDRDRLPLKLPKERKKLTSGTFKIRGDISSQFITGLIYALPLLKGDSRLEMITELESKPYMDLTMKALRDFGIEIKNKDYKIFEISGSQKYKGGSYKVEGDFSQLTFFAVAGLIGKYPITVTGLDKNSLQGDKEIINILKRMKGKIEEAKEGYTFYPSLTEGTVIDIKECPDLAPALSVLASLSKGETRIINGERLKIKESNRLESTSKELIKLGADIDILEDSLVIRGVEELKGGRVDSWNDHRVAMSLGVASARAKNDIILTGAESVSKSYPRFWEDFKKLGGIISE